VSKLNPFHGSQSISLSEHQRTDYPVPKLLSLYGRPPFILYFVLVLVVAIGLQVCTQYQTHLCLSFGLT